MQLLDETQLHAALSLADAAAAALLLLLQWKNNFHGKRVKYRPLQQWRQLTVGALFIGSAVVEHLEARTCD